MLCNFIWLMSMSVLNFTTLVAKSYVKKRFVLICNKGEMNAPMSETVKLVADAILNTQMPFLRNPSVYIILNIFNFNILFLPLFSSLNFEKSPNCTCVMET